MIELTKEELTLIAAVVAAIGATIAAFINLFSSSRSKYVDTITLTRIAWVQELRRDFAELISAMTALSTAEEHELAEDAQYELQIRAIDKLMLLSLKLNRRSPLDREIGKLMKVALWAAIGEKEDEFSSASARLAIMVEELLKEEWEKAKFEASGPIRRIRIWLGHRRRKKVWTQRIHRWASEDPQKTAATENASE